MGKLTYDKESLTFVEKKKTVGYYLKRLLVFLGYSILSGVIIYLAFSLIVTTEKQRKIKSETRCGTKKNEHFQGFSSKMPVGPPCGI